MSYIGDFAVGSTVCIYFTTGAADGGREDFSGGVHLSTADFKIYKNGNNLRSSMSGVTIIEAVITGLSYVLINLSDNTHDGFYAAGNEYSLVIYPDEILDGQLVTAQKQFSIQNRYMRGTDSAAHPGDAMTLEADQAVDVIKIDGAAINTALAQVGVNIVSEDNIDFGALKKTSLNAATPAVTVSDKTGFSLSTAGILAIWHQLENAIVTAGTIGIRIKTYLDALISTRATSAKQDIIDTNVDAVQAQTDKMTFNADNDINASLSIAGAGATEVDYYVYTDEEALTGPIGTCKVWVTTDSDGLNLVASGYTDDFGKVTFYLDSGTYYLWRKKTGYNFTNPDTEVIA